MLELPSNAVDAPLLAQPRTGLPEAERDARIDALSPQVEYPIEIAHTRVIARLAPARHRIDPPLGEVAAQVEAFEQRFADHLAAAQRQREVDRQPIVGALLRLAGTAQHHMRPAFAPVRRQAGRDAIDALGNHQEGTVAPLADHRPRFAAPRVGLLDEKIGGETGIDRLAGRNLVTSRPVAPHGKVEGRRPAHLRSILLPPRILTVDIAATASLAHFAAPVPQIPAGHKTGNRPEPNGPGNLRRAP